MFGLLRQDLKLVEGTQNKSGAPSWVLYDPLRQCYFNLGWLEVEMLRTLGDSATPDECQQVAERLSKQHQIPVDEADVAGFVEFLDENNLTLTRQGEQRSHRLAKQLAGKPGWLKRLAKQYLFIKIPLVNPDRALSALVPRFEWVFHRYTLRLLIFLSALGALLALRNWSYFSIAIAEMLTPQGMTLFLMALALVKIIHELGHAIAAKRFGCAVPGMGVALMVFWPVLYTDTTDAWRLNSKTERLWIGAAGILAELIVALICLILWILLPDGTSKQICFLLATSTWLLTLAVNLNPLMRFDGYFLLADWLGVENLQSRSFALGRWKLRRLLLGMKELPPEPEKLSLLCFAYAAWVYRFFLVLGIGWIVYELVFKALGVLLVVYYLYSALMKPVLNELKVIFSNRHLITWKPNGVISLSLLALFIAWLFIPTATTIILPATAQAARFATLVAPLESKIRTMPAAGEQVTKGQVLFELDAPDIEQSITTTELELKALNWQLQHQNLATGHLGTSYRIQGELSVVHDKLKALRAMKQATQIRAPFAGAVQSVTPDIKLDDWLAKGSPLAVLVDDTRLQVEAYIEERYINDLIADKTALFYPEGGSLSPVKIKLESVEMFATEQLDLPYNASIYGGELQVHSVPGSQALKLDNGVYRLKFSTDAANTQRVLRGSVVLEIADHSVVEQVMQRITSLWRREAGF